MSTSSSTVERRPVPSVAIVGNDAVLAAAPATPVQLAHACLQYGFSVAVPASWGDELVAGETVRRLASREKGPAVMCVCPFVRSRLLAPGPDLAPFLVSLVAPPVAAARYVRAAYGEHGVEITYIGTCPSADDSAIDIRLTPDAFLADIADRGIALADQPLVFDSIVPPDRRRWCSLPGGVPTQEVLWNEADARTLVEIDPDDVSTDLAQHIITREHVLLDLAPALGCACSGAIAAAPPRSARVAVTAMEPPRALGPVIDPASLIPLDAPVVAATVTPRPTPIDVESNVDPVPASELTAVVADMLDLEIGRQLWNDDASGNPTASPSSADSTGAPPPPVAVLAHAVIQLHAELGPDAPGVRWVDRPSERRTGAVDVAIEAPSEAGETPATARESAPSSAIAEGYPRAAVEIADTAAAIAVEPAPLVVADSAIETLVESLPEPPSEDPSDQSDADAGATADSSATLEVRRRTPTSFPVRHASANIPRTTATGGRSLPRAYVAKRRTTPPGIAAVQDDVPPSAPTAPSEAMRPEIASRPVATATEVLQPPVAQVRNPESLLSPASSTASRSPPSAPDAAPEFRSPSNGGPSRRRERESLRDSAPSGGAAGERPLVILLVVALVVLAAFVMWML